MKHLSIRALVSFSAALFVATASGQDSGASQAPRILVHYMPWYQAKPFAPTWGWHWTMDHFNPDVLDMSDRREIASHFYPLIGPYDSRDEDVIEYHVLLMKVAGIDGVIVDWYGTSGLFDYPLIHDATQRTFNAIRHAGLSFAVCYEDQTVKHLIDRGALTAGQAVAHAQEQMEFVRDEWIADPAYLRLDDAPVILNFGPQYFASSAQWEQILSVLDEPAAFFTLDERLTPVATGAFAWPPMHIAGGRTLSRGDLDRYLNLFYAYGRLEWPAFIGGAFPGFHDIYEEAGAGASYGFLDSRDGQTFSSTLDRALDENSPLIQIATWNDFGEGTNIEPTREYGYQFLLEVQEAAAALRDLPYTAADLETPLALYELRKHFSGRATEQVRLDEAAQLIISGDTESARALLATLSGSERRSEVPERRLELEVYPNPATNGATISVTLRQAGMLDISLFDVLGREVATIANGHRTHGQINLEWTATDVGPGFYFVRARHGGRSTTERLILVD